MSNQVVDYYADWCGPCKAMTPIIEQFAAKHDLELVKVNIDEDFERAQEAGVSSIPTVQLVKDGAIQATSVGLKPLAKLEQELGLD